MKARQSIRKSGLSAALLMATLLASACAGILGLTPRHTRPTFEHRAHVIEGVQCVRCHDAVENATDDEPVKFPSTASCIDCHKKPHNENDCGNCHGAASTRQAASLARKHLRFSHNEHIKRGGGDCVRCHLDIKEEGHTLRPSMATCLSCHAHEDQWAARSCDPCHIDLPAEAVMPEDHLIHDPGFVKTHALPAATDAQMCASCHSQRFCLGCHGGNTAPVLPERMAFDKPVMGGGIHRAGFRSRHAEEARGEPGLCVRCHAPSSCALCHERENVGTTGRLGERKSPHPTGWLGLPGQPNEHGAASWRDPALCASCHGGAGEALCINCHRVGAPGGNPHAPGFSSRANAKTDKPCVFCHGGLP